ncbi:MAG: archease [Halodesulfurarchaeum sp.]
MPYRLREHTADVAVEATADSLGEAFGAAADGMAAAMADEIPEGVGKRFEFTLEAESREALLFDYLDRLIYERDVREVLPVDNRAVVRSEGDRFRVEASARGIPFDEVDARDLKAVTYSQMVLERRGEEWYAYVVFDV